MPRYLPKLMKHICIMLQEHAKTSHDMYTLHQTIPRGQYPVKKRMMYVILEGKYNHFRTGLTIKW